jgi:CBS domain-containing protein
MATIKDFLQKGHPTVSLKDSLESVAPRFLGPWAAADEQADCLVVLDAEGRPAGLINAWLILRAIAIGAEKEDEPAVDALMKDRLQLPVTAAMATKFPVADPEDDLFSVLAPLGSNYFECIPVMEGEVYLGAVRTIDLFQAVAEEILGTSGGVFTDL